MFYLPLAVVISVPVFACLKKEIIAVDGELHADLEALLIEKDFRQEDLWGINLYLEKPLKERIEYTALINIRPS